MKSIGDLSNFLISTGPAKATLTIFSMLREREHYIDLIGITTYKILKY